MLKSTGFQAGFKSTVNDQTTYWYSGANGSISTATANLLTVNPQIIVSTTEPSDFRGYVIRLLGSANNEVLNYRVYSIPKHDNGLFSGMLLCNGTATVGTGAPGGTPQFNNAAGTEITMNYCDTITTTVSAYATALQNMQDITNGINYHSPADNTVAELLIPDCFGANILVAMQPNVAGNSYVGYMARALR